MANVLNDDMRFGTGKGIVEASDDESSQEIVTPKAKQHIVLSSNSISDSRALLALREYRSNPDTTLDEHVSDKATRSDLKRRSLLNGKNFMIVEILIAQLFFQSHERQKDDE